MKVIDLLNKIANGEVPEKIKVNEKFIYEHDGIDYKSENGKYLFDSYIEITKEDMNMEVEIIEDTPKEDKKIEDIARFQYSQIPSWFDIKELIKAVNENFEKHQKALKEIIDKINEIIELLERIKNL